MRFDIVTLFPDLIENYLDTSILGRARRAGSITFVIHNLRHYGIGKHQTVDDTPYGGGAGMVLRVDVVASCLSAISQELDTQQIEINQRATFLLCPQGTTFQQQTAERLSRDFSQITLVCGHYEGFDERIRTLVDNEISLGEFVLTGGELAALAVVDAVSRLIPGVLSDGSAHEESWSLRDPVTRERLLEYPHFTRPADYNGAKVPEVLVSGNHAVIRKWRLEQARSRTAKKRQVPFHRKTIHS